MVAFLYRWLPIFFGCHCRSDRSFHWRGRQFPICARCTGELIGILLGIVIGMFGLWPVGLCFALLLPLILDGFVQRLTSYESNNIRRLWTGILFGIGFYMLLAHYVLFFVNWGYELGSAWRLSRQTGQ